eukprot:2130754-Pyramimonas_sp.AAC.1
MALPNNVIRFCGSHEVLLEHIWPGLCCSITSGLCYKNLDYSNSGTVGPCSMVDALALGAQWKHMARDALLASRVP